MHVAMVARVMACAGVSLVSGCVNIRVQARFTYCVGLAASVDAVNNGRGDVY